MTVEITNRKTAWTELKNFDCLAKDSDFIEITEWSNGEGWDICIDENYIHLTHGQLEAINYLTKHLEICD